MSIELIIGPMFAGKTKELLRRIKEVERNPMNKVLCITHSSDDRYAIDGKIVSHDGKTHSAVAVRELMPLVSDPLYKDATHIMIEESQFFPDLFVFVTYAADAHIKHLVCAGLDGDFMREPIGQVLSLVPHCDNVEKLKANCSRCSDKHTAIFTARRRGHGSVQIYVGGKELYQPLCRKHYMEYYYQ